MLTYEQAIALRYQRDTRTAVAAYTLDELHAIAQGRAGVPVVQRPWVEMPASGKSFNQQNQAQVLLPAIGTTVTVVTVTVPQGYHGVIKRIANQFVGGGWTEGTGDLVWRILVDAMPLQNYSNIIASLGAISDPTHLEEAIRIYENQVIQLVANNVAVVVAGQPLLGLLGGWFYPVSAALQPEWL
ncbi:MAG: hypothetical protein L0212_04165 [Acidobacteria bacterium]|nr:hypothetical protein [Acidobacteriota bacterium]